LRGGPVTACAPAGRGGQAQQTAAAIGVDQETRAAGARLNRDVGGQARQQERVVLKEVAGRELQRQVADLLGDHGAGIDGDARGRLADQQRSPAVVAAPLGRHLGPQLGELATLGELVRLPVAPPAALVQGDVPK